jgi:arabinogalactan endo-1,4-beta-galactosidase
MKREGQQAGKEKTADVKTFTKMMKLYALLSGVVLIALIILSIVFIKRLKASNTGSKIPSGEVKSSITIQKINGISDDFIKGVDISSLISEEESGVIYYDEDGNKSDLIKILADEGINYIRVRVWNDPYDTHGCGYGGGNCDTEKAAQIGKRAAKYGIKLLVDYHYSDFWADPSKQMSPKAWAHLTWDNKQEAIYTWTRESLKTIIDAGADVGMVQIGNEINNGMAGETDNEKICLLLSQASKAVREISEENGISIKVAVHYTNVSDADGIDKIAQMLAQNNVDYDVFGLSLTILFHSLDEYS